jgi:hypothetical protein
LCSWLSGSAEQLSSRGVKVKQDLTTIMRSFIISFCCCCRQRDAAVFHLQPLRPDKWEESWVRTDLSLE